jgi:uncharacterized membrane protein HdeD (DUF308 family)
MSSTGFPFFRSQVAAELDAIHHRWGWLLAWGVLLIIGGIAALTYPVAATVISVKIFGFVLLFAAAGQFIAAFSARGWGGVLAAVLCGVLYLFAGIVLLDRPLLGAAGYTLFLAMMFFAIGIVRIVAAVINQFSGWGWALLSGGIDVLLAMLIWQNYPESALWVIGVFVGIDLIFAGWSLVMTGLAARRLPTLTSAPAV